MNINLKRFSAFCLDMMVILLLLVAFNYFIPESRKTRILNQELNTLNEKYIQKHVEFKQYLKEYSIIIQNVEKERMRFTIINLVVMLAYFVFVPFYNKGQTFGLYMLDLKIKHKGKKKDDLLALLLRSLVINGIGYLVILIWLIYLIPGDLYFIFASILGFVQILLVIISVFMIIYWKEKKGLHELISDTKVMSLK